MRQRKIKNIEEKLTVYDSLIVVDPQGWRGQWRRELSGSVVEESTHTIDSVRAPDIAALPSLYAEIGCGKGRFITESALSDDSGIYLAFEGQESVLYRALQRACAGSGPSSREIYEAAQIAGPMNAPKNLRFIRSYIEDVTHFFADGELDGIYLNFSDPWPKVRQEKRRLTSPHYLSGYLKVLRPGGFLRFKTDNDALFEYSIGVIRAEEGFRITKLTDDLHGSEYAEGNIETEYERKFKNLRRKIHFVEAVKG
jgi:tRNA (guanine-N7-)-methyltransferase